MAFGVFGRRDVPPRLALLLVALFVLMSVPADAVRAAPDTAGDDSWAGSWTVLGPGAAAQGAISGLSPAAGSVGVTLAAGMESGSLTTPAHDMGRRFMALGAVWEAVLPDGAGLRLSVRVSEDGASWGPWQALVVDDLLPEPGRFHSELLFGWGRYVQCRVDLERGTASLAPALTALRLVAIDAGSGPSIEDAGAPSVGAPEGAPAVITRAQWGAGDSACSRWPPAYAPVSHIVVHHTTGSNAFAESDPAAFIRAIYIYHADSLGWGDIGYNYLIDRQGRIYEGRCGGTRVIGGHAAPYNSGTIGVSILGDYTASYVPAAAVAGLEAFLAWKCQAHGINPQGSGWLRDRVFPNIMGHRDCGQTTCPGDRAYALLPQLRSHVALRLATPPALAVHNPRPDQWVAGVCLVEWEVSPGTTQVTVAVDGAVHATLSGTTTSWAWNSASLSDGRHSLRIAARNSLGQATSVDVSVRVDNTPPSGTMSAPAMTIAAEASLSLSCQGCTSMQFGRGWRWEGEDLPGQTGIVAADPAASNGRAMLARVGVDGWGAWYGPYFCGLPAPGDYEAVFWLRSGRNDVAANVAEIDVSDSMGHRFLAGPRPLPANAFAATGGYQAFVMPFHYPDPAETCRDCTDDGLELRTWYQPGVANLWLDRVEIMTAPQPFASNVRFPLPEADGRYTLEVRFQDAAGNLSPLYTKTVTVDRTAPGWGQPGAAGLPVSDSLTGLAGSSAYSLSDDGIHWGPWTQIALGADGLVPAQANWAGRCVRARVQDAAGNTTSSPPIRWPQPGDPDPQYVWWDSCGARAYLPHIMRQAR